MKGPLSRLMGLWTLCLLLLSWGAEAGGAHACPHHARIGAPSAQAADEGHHHHGGPAEDAGGQHQACTCASGCPASGAVFLPRADQPALHALVLAAASPVSTRPQPRPRHPAPHVLPYSLAPPLG